MPEFEEPSDDTTSCSDELLAKLERAAEFDGAIPISSQGDCENIDHQRLYQLVDELAAPIRFALGSIGAAPQLSEYSDLVEIGRGGMGVVYRGFHRKMQRTDAIKVIRPDRLATASREMVKQMQFRFEQESQLAARIAHEHIVPVYQVGQVGDSAWFSMQFVDGRSLQDLSRTHSLSCEQAVRYIERIARAVDAVHRHGVLHGDIKPHNILIESETDRPLITDFGLADFMACRTMAPRLGVAGTPAYMAPELARAALERRTPDEVASVRSIASDIYSLGATLSEVLRGSSSHNDILGPRQPFASVVNRSDRIAGESGASVPTALRQICLKSLSENPVDRYASAREFADALSAWLDRPRWNRHFPKLRQLLWMVVAPALLSSGLVVSWLLQVQAAEAWVWIAIFFGYLPLFASFGVSQTPHRAADPARREIWAVWLGHFAGSLACMISLRILCHADLARTLTFYYPCWAAVSAVVFFAKSANFWSTYRWIGLGWSGIAILLAATPTHAPLVFGALAAITCLIIARGDRAFLDE